MTAWNENDLVPFDPQSIRIGENDPFDRSRCRLDARLARSRFIAAASYRRKSRCFHTSLVLFNQKAAAPTEDRLLYAPAYRTRYPLHPAVKSAPRSRARNHPLLV